MKRWPIIAALLALVGCGSEKPPGPVVLVGDSITRLMDTVIPGDWLDTGVPGFTTLQMLSQFKTVLALKPSVVAILGGTNDLHWYPGPPNMDALSEMASSAAYAGACVILGTIPPQAPQFDQQRVSDWNNAVRQLALDNGYQIAEYYDAMVLPDGTQDASMFIFDGIHPNAAGLQAMLSVLTTQVESCP